MAASRTSSSHPIRVDWINDDLPGKIGLTFAPGKRARSTYQAGRWERDLRMDLDRLVDVHGMRVQVCLLEDHELKHLKIPTLIEDATARGVRVVRLPIPDAGVLPELSPVQAIVDDIITAARAGNNVVIHCAGGLGRAGTIGGCVLARLGKSSDEALEVLISVRSPNCPETEEQRNFIRRFARAQTSASTTRHNQSEGFPGMTADWFEALTGFPERSYEETQSNFEILGHTLRSKVNGRSYLIGELETPSLGELRQRAASVLGTLAGTVSVSIATGDVAEMHRNPANRNAVFQVASQFNLLEMTGPKVTPEDGVTRYMFDYTQGAACARAAGAATIYRNYFAPVQGHAGQTRHRQLDCLSDLGAALGNENNALWTMSNGYALCTEPGLSAIRRRLKDLPEERDSLRDLLRVGIHWGVQVTTAEPTDQVVSQAFCSALPISYTDIPTERWTSFATLVLEGAYEATLWAAVLNAHRYSSNVIFLTQLGGGAFGNESPWIHGAIRRALHMVKGQGLDVRLVSYKTPSRELVRLAHEFA